MTSHFFQLQFHLNSTFFISNLPLVNMPCISECPSCVMHKSKFIFEHYAMYCNPFNHTKFRNIMHNIRACIVKYLIFLAMWFNGLRWTYIKYIVIHFDDHKHSFFNIMIFYIEIIKNNKNLFCKYLYKWFNI